MQVAHTTDADQADANVVHNAGTVPPFVLVMTDLLSGRRRAPR
jgi:hypothetical protein